MIIDLFEIKKFIDVNELQEVSNPIYLNSDKTPTIDGIFSYDIFGIPGTRERNEMFAYIDLGEYFFHPLIYRQLIQMDKRIKDCVEGNKDFFIDSNGTLTAYKSGSEIPDKAPYGTGIVWLYQNFEKIKFQRNNDFSTRDTKITVFEELKKEELFTRYWLIHPCSIRDLNFAQLGAGRISINELNEYYIAILNASSALKRNASASFMNIMTTVRLQNLLVQLYDFQKARFKGKGGLLKQNVIGKNIDYSCRLVIAPPKISRAETYKDVEVKISEFGLPLHAACSIFKPFVINRVREIFGDYFKGKTRVMLGPKLEENIELTSDVLSDFAVEKMIDFFVRSPESRFDPIMTETKEGKKVPLEVFKQILNRDFSIADLLFIACSKAIENCHILNTRYPIDSYQNNNPVKPVIITTEKTMHVKFYTLIGEYWNYPDIKYRDLWRDQGILDPMMTGVYGADFDGDMTSIIPLFTNEANIEADSLINSKVNLLNMEGKPARKLSKEAVLSLYMFTKK
jgi:DNA-directed RNA polymerase beta' subunit